MNPHLSADGVWFPNWPEVLAKVRLKELERRAYRLAIVGYLTFCKRARQRATVVSARLFMAEVEAQRRLSRSQLAVWKAALNWFFKMALATPSGGAPGGKATSLISHFAITSPRPAPHRLRRLRRRGEGENAET
jgi:hypothetical protein